MTENQPSCCPRSSSEIKAWVRQKLNLSEKETVFVSVCGSCEEEALTLVMVIDEDQEKDNFRFYKINKIPQRVMENDIPDEMNANCCMQLVQVQYLEGKLALA